MTIQELTNEQLITKVWNSAIAHAAQLCLETKKDNPISKECAEVILTAIGDLPVALSLIN